MLTLADVLSKFVNLPNVEPLNVFNASILVCCDADEVFNADTDVLTLALNVFKFETDILTLAEVNSKFVNLTSCVSFVDFAVDAEVINEPLTTPISVNLVSTEELNDSMLDNLPNVEELNEFKFVIETPAPLPTDALKAEIEDEIEPLKSPYPVVDEMVICDEPLTTLSPPANNTLDSASLAPAFQ